MITLTCANPACLRTFPSAHVTRLPTYCSRPCAYAVLGDGRLKGKNASRWNGGRRMDCDGYVTIYAPEHPRSKPGRIGTYYIPEHVLIAEKALGRPLPMSVKVHHANRIKDDNRNCNLVICQDEAYHQLLHRRLRIVEAGGNPDTGKICGRCQAVKSKDLFHLDRTTADGRYGYCKECRLLKLAA